MHCIDRAWERYALILSEPDVFALERQIKERRSVVVRREEAATEIHLVQHEGIVMVAVWALDEGGRFMRIVTFLPEESVRGGAQVRRFTLYGEREARGGRRRKQRRSRPAPLYA